MDEIGDFTLSWGLSKSMRRFGYLALPAFAGYLLSLLLSLAVQETHAQRLPIAPPGDTPAAAGPLARGLSAKFSKRDLAKAIKLVADWQLGRLPAEPQVDWTWAALYTGFMGVPDQVAGDKYKQAMMKVAEQLYWQPGPRIMMADDQAIGQTYLELYAIHKEPKMMEPMRARLDQEMATPDAPKEPVWWWCDALFMAPPVFAEMAKQTGDPRYLTYMDHEWTITSDLLYDRNQHLYSRDAAYLDAHEKNGQKVFWARGNGWVMGGIVRVLQQLPADSPLRPKYVALLKDMAAASLAVQGSDGLWRPGLLDPNAYPLPEVSASAFITYAMAYGVSEGILDRKTYWPAVHKAWAGLLSHVYADGRLGCIQPIGHAPDAFGATSSYAYGVGAYLLAGSEIYRTAK